ncbi:MAG: sterol desaturase family protein [Myxococcaceae bacterium]|nr:sterol desaturase family protein [Myxococcaceae bacterium]MCI0671122.1 sterol desaturase family protein [Myxococcaceae bacterium]
MVGFPLGLLASNAGEWAIHRYMLHGLGRSKDSVWAFHWNEHHNAVRRNAMLDPAYTHPLVKAWDAQSKEALALLLGAAVWLPVLKRIPYFVSAVWFSMWRYHRLHKKAHLDPAWARVHLPWHYEHHMGVDQNANWCVTFPLFDWILGTRKRFL